VDGEWVLANFEVAEGNRVTAAAGRARTASGTAAVTFEPRDWERLLAFSGGQQPAPQAAQLAQPPEQAAVRSNEDEQDEAPKTLPMPISIPRISGFRLGRVW